MRLLPPAVLLVVLGCTSTEPSRPEPDLSRWRASRARADVDDAIGHRDYRLLSMMGIGAYTPGIDGQRTWPTVDGRPVGTIDLGGSDAIAPEDVPVQQAMEGYAARYNGLMADYLAAHPRPATTRAVAASD